jgi:hypothetical protein
MFKQKLVANVIILALLLTLALQVTTFGISISSKKAFSGIVYASTGIPVSGAMVTAYGSNGSGLATTDASGHFLINEGLQTGTYTVMTMKDGYLYSTVENVLVTAPSETSGVTIYLNLSGVISGKVTDNDTSNGLPSITLFAMPSSGSSSYFGVAETDASGNYEITMNLGTGSYNVSVSLPQGYVGLTKGPVSVTAGSKTTGTNLSLKKSGIISGRITTLLGAPLANLTVIAMSSSGTTTYYGTGETNATGYYRITSGLGTGSYDVIVSSGIDFNQTSDVSVTAGSETPNINLQLDITPPSPSGIITGKVTDESSKPIVGAEVEADGQTTYSSGSATTDEQGNYVIFEGLPNDTYTVTASHVGYVPANRTNVNVVENQVTSDINFQLQSIPSAQSGRISGTVNGDANPIPEFQYPIVVMLVISLVAVAIVKSYTPKIRNQKALAK